MHGRPGRNEDAAASAFAFLVAGVIFIGAMGTALHFSATMPHDSAAAELAVLQNKATALADVLSQSPGIGGPDDLRRFGLANPGGGLDPERLDQLCGAGIETAPEGKYGYQQVRTSFDLENEEFLIRVSPATRVDVSFPDIRTAYVQAILPEVDFQNSVIDEFKKINEDWQGVIDDIATAIASGQSPLEQDYVAMFDAMAETGALEERDAFANMGVSFDNKPNTESASIDDSITIVEAQVDPVTGEVITPAIQADIEDHMVGYDASGDVFFDRQSILEDTLISALPGYHLLVIGTHVDHTEISPLVADAIKDFAVNGGVVFVLGGWDTWPAWLDRLAAHASVGETRDTHAALEHPIFKSPYPIKAEAYAHRVAPPLMTESIIDGIAVQHDWGDWAFDHVLTGDSDLLPDARSFFSASRCGVLGDGFVALSSYQATSGANSGGTVLRMEEQFGHTTEYLGALKDQAVMELLEYVEKDNYDPDSDCFGMAASQNCASVSPVGSEPAERFMINTIHYGLTDHLHLQMGQAIPPADQATAYAKRITWVDDPTYGQIPMQVEVWIRGG